MKILPEEIPNDTAPLSEVPLEFSNHSIEFLRNSNRKNVFVSLLTGKTLVGQLNWVDKNSFTVGFSNPIDISIVENAREV